MAISLSSFSVLSKSIFILVPKSVLIVFIYVSRVSRLATAPLYFCLTSVNSSLSSSIWYLSYSVFSFFLAPSCVKFLSAWVILPVNTLVLSSLITDNPPSVMTLAPIELIPPGPRPSYPLYFLTWAFSSSTFCDRPFHWDSSLESSWISTHSPISLSNSLVAFSRRIFCSWFSFRRLVILFSKSLDFLSSPPGLPRIKVLASCCC